MDTLLSLRVLAEVAEHKSFTYAADRLGLSAAMTSKHVKHIESRVGARLLNRNSRNVSLTEAGEHYLASVKPLLDGVDEAETQLSDKALGAQGTLKVSLPVWMANPSFSRLINDYHIQNPNVVLDLDLSGKNINLVEEGIDIALRVSTSLDEGLIARKLSKVNFRLVAAPKFLDSYGRPETVEDLKGSPFLNYNQMGTNGHIKYGKGIDALDIRFNPVLHTGNETLIHQVARQGMGFAFLPHWLSNEDIENGILELVLPDIAWPVVPLYAIYSNRNYLPSKIRNFLDFLAGPNGLSK